MTNPTPDLLPCPFCGGDAKFLEWESDSQTQAYCGVRCRCGAEISADVHWSGHDLLDHKTHAIAAWNTRTPTPAPNAGAVKVKPLVWDMSGPVKRSGDYSALWYPQGVWGLSWRGSSKSMARGLTTIDAFMSAAQADHAARIMAAIETTPDPRDEVIARLVEAAELADAALRGANMNMGVVHAKMSAALAAAKVVMK